MTENSTVLVVDDRPANRYTAAHALRRAGFSVAEASTGMEALELSKQKPEAIVLDVKLPDILGYEVCRRIKANPATTHIPILQLSAAFLDNESKVYALESGADAYLNQPVEPIVLVATVRSLVRLHKAEAQAKLSAAQWQATFDALSEGVALIDSTGCVQRCNRSMSALLNRPYSELEHSSFEDLLRDNFATVFTFEELQSPREVRLENRFFQISAHSVIGHGEPSGYIFIAADITDKKLSEGALLVSERLAATGRLAHTIAHEINNPLEAITNLIYLLKGSLRDPEVAKRYIDSTDSELQRVCRITRQILSFNRESGVPIEIRLVDLIEDVLALNNKAIVDKQIRIAKSGDMALVVKGFPAQLRQVFSNLIRNAIEASHAKSQIHIRFTASRQWKTGAVPAARVSIIDQGIGIPPSNVRRIFDAFFTTKDLKGSGIGLWLSSNIIREHRGSLQVRSRTKPSNPGTCVCVVLPRESAIP